MGAVEDAVARLEAQVPSRTVYPYAVPDGTLPARYLVVYGSEGSEESSRACGTVNVQTAAVWVHSVSRDANPVVAAREAAWGAQKARKALRNFKPAASWSFHAEASQPARRDDSITTVSTFLAVEQFSLRNTL